MTVLNVQSMTKFIKKRNGSFMRTMGFVESAFGIW